MEDIGKRSLALTEKGKLARVLDKTHDLEEVMKLLEKLRQTILVYHVSIRLHRYRKPFTRGTGITGTVNIQSTHSIDGEFLPFWLQFRD